MPESGDDGGELRFFQPVRPVSAAEGSGGELQTSLVELHPLLGRNRAVPQLQTPPAACAVRLTHKKKSGGLGDAKGIHSTIQIPSSLSPQKSFSAWAELTPNQWDWEKPKRPKSRCSLSS